MFGIGNLGRLGSQGGTAGAPFVPPVPTTWNVTDAAGAAGVTTWTLTNNNLDVAINFNDENHYKSIRTSDVKSSGLWYVEFQVDVASASNNWGVGVTDGNNPIGAFSGTNTAAAIFNGSGLAAGGSVSVGGGTVPTANATLGLNIGLAINYTTGKAWVSANGSYINGSPTAGTGPDFTFAPGFGLSPAFFITFGDTGTNGTWKLQATIANQTYSPPVGFSCWDNN